MVPHRARPVIGLREWEPCDRTTSAARFAFLGPHLDAVALSMLRMERRLARWEAHVAGYKRFPGQREVREAVRGIQRAEVGLRASRAALTRARAEWEARHTSAQG